MEDLKKFIKINENHETLITIYIYNKNVLEIITLFEKELEKAKNITNPIKKNKICSRYYNFIKKIYELDEEHIINSIFLINDTIYEYKLEKNNINTIIEYKLKDIFYILDNHFHIPYLLDLFTNFDFIYSIYVSKNNAQLIKLNENKNKIVYENKINNENELHEIITTCKNEYNYKNLIIIYGESLLLNKLEPSKSYLVINEKQKYNEIYIIYQEKIYKNNLELLEKKLNELNNEKTNLDLFVFGKLKIEIKEAIETYSLKELYIEERKLELLKDILEPEYFNFKIILIRSFHNGDIGYRFINDYKGLMGIKYF
jgi:hypothetical protein